MLAPELHDCAALGYAALLEDTRPIGWTDFRDDAGAALEIDGAEGAAGIDLGAVCRDDVDFAVAVDDADFEQGDGLIANADLDLAEATVIAANLDHVVAVDGEASRLATQEQVALVELAAFALLSDPAFSELAEDFNVGLTTEIGASNDRRAGFP